MRRNHAGRIVLLIAPRGPGRDPRPFADAAAAAGACRAAEGDHQLDRHEAGADPGRRVPDGLARFGQGCLGRREAAAPGADHAAVLPGGDRGDAGSVPGGHRRRTRATSKGRTTCRWRGLLGRRIAFCNKLNELGEGDSWRGASGTGCRRRRSGSMPAGRGARRGTASATTRRAWASMPGSCGNSGKQDSSGGPEAAERLRPVRYARQCLGVVLGRVRGRILHEVARRRSARSLAGRGPGDPGRELDRARSTRGRRPERGTPGYRTSAWASAWPESVRTVGAGQEPSPSLCPKRRASRAAAPPGRSGMSSFSPWWTNRLGRRALCLLRP